MIVESRWSSILVTGDTVSSQLALSLIQRIVDSMYQWYGESQWVIWSQFNEFQKAHPHAFKEQFGKKARDVMYSLQIIYLKGFKKGLHTAILPTLRHCLCGELIFIMNISASSKLIKATALTLVLGVLAKSIHPKNRISLPCLFN
jgi:hypothetical protein